MNPYTLDFKEYYSEIIDAITEVYGHKYYQIIKQRFNNIVYIPYINVDGIEAYYNHLVSCKSKELSLEFLSSIGIDINKYNIETFAKEFPQELHDLCYGYLGSITPFEEYYLNHALGFKSLLTKYESSIFEEHNKAKFINFIRGNDKEKITEDNLEEFSKTDEYHQIYNLALKLDEIFTPLAEKMKIYLEGIKEYKDYYTSEEERLREILENKKIELYLSIKDDIKGKIKGVLDKEKSIKDESNKLLNEPLDWKSDIEYFSEDYEIKLNDPTYPDYNKKWIYRSRLKYLKNMGIEIDVYNTDYNELIKREDIKKLIPYSVFASEITRLRNIYLEEANKQFIIESSSYKNITSKMGNNESTQNKIYDIIINEKVCLAHGIDEFKKFIPLIFITVRRGTCEILDETILHEIIHAIEAEITKDNKNRCGFELDINEGNYSSYKHHDRKRKYERLNETITDILALEVREILFKKGIYFAEPKLRTNKDASNYNTTKLQKDLLKPFIDKYRELILETRIYGNLDKLKRTIGEDNFEELNDTVDYIDYLTEQGLVSKLEQNLTDDAIVLEYNIQLERLNNIYMNMGINIENKDTHQTSYTRKLTKHG